MAITRPVTKTIISTTDWGIPITDEVNRLTTVAAGITAPTWVTPTLLTGFGNVSGNCPFQYAVVGNMVFMRGMVQNNTGAIMQAYVNIANALPKPATYDFIFGGIVTSTTINDGRQLRGKVAVADGSVQIGTSSTNPVAVGGWFSLFNTMYFTN